MFCNKDKNLSKATKHGRGRKEVLGFVIITICLTDGFKGGKRKEARRLVSLTLNRFNVEEDKSILTLSEFGDGSPSRWL